MRRQKRSVQLALYPPLDWPTHHMVQWITSTEETHTVVQLTNQKSAKIFPSCVVRYHIPKPHQFSCLRWSSVPGHLQKTCCADEKQAKEFHPCKSALGSKVSLVHQLSFSPCLAMVTILLDCKKFWRKVSPRIGSVVQWCWGHQICSSPGLFFMVARWLLLFQTSHPY